jgi:hypothetical protein
LYPETGSVAIVSTAPLGRGLDTTSYNDAPRIKITRIDAEPGFFALMKIPVLVGRDFVPSDDYGSTVIISRRVAMEMYGNRSASFERKHDSAELLRCLERGGAHGHDKSRAYLDTLVNHSWRRVLYFRSVRMSGI